MMQISRTILIASALCAPPLARAQERLPTTLPASQQPTTRPRHVAQVPPGFKRLELDGRTFFVMPADEAWLRQAVAEMTPATMPTTMPADLLANLGARRATLRQRMAFDVGIAPADVDEYLDQRLKVFLTRVEQLRPPVIYLVASPQQVKDAMKAGWTDPRYRYNRAADDVNFSTTVNLTMDEGGDDMVLPLFFADNDPPEARQKRAAAEMRATEASILNAISSRAQSMMMVAMVELISSKVLDALDLKPDQEWFGVGVAGVLGAKYVAILTGMSEARLLNDMTRQHPNNPMRPTSLDLLHPTNLGDVRPEWMEAYTDAYRRRSMMVVWRFLAKAGEGSIAKVIAAMKKSPPADGAALVQLIKDTTGVDLTSELRPK
jgi:hypothetical protein